MKLGKSISKLPPSVDVHKTIMECVWSFPLQMWAPERRAGPHRFFIKSV